MRLLVLSLLSAYALASPHTFEDSPPSFKVTLGDEWASQEVLNEQNEGHLYSIRNENFQYACNISVPSASKYLEALNGNSTQLELQKKEAIRAIKDFNTVHKNECIYRELGYWSYRACFGHDFTQFHYAGDRMKVHQELETDPTIPSHRLGNVKTDSFDKSSDFEFVKASDGSRYLSQLVYNGSVCDLTGKDRSVFVQYKCDVNHAVPIIADVDELKTCQYRLVVAAAELCQYAVLRPENYITRANITCSPVNEVQGEEVDAEADLEDILAVHEKLDLTSMQLQPVGEGLFLGTFKELALSLRPHIFVSNKEYPNLGKGADKNRTEAISPSGDEAELLSDVGKAFMNMIKSKRVLTPGGIVPRRPLKPEDRFEYVAELYGLNREFIANIAIEQSDNGFLVTYFKSYGAARDNFVSFTASRSNTEEESTADEQSSTSASEASP